MNIPGWDKLDAEQRALVEWQYRLCGDFKAALWQAICRADDTNMGRLHAAFPVEVNAYRKYTEQANYWLDTVTLAGGDVEAGY